MTQITTLGGIFTGLLGFFGDAIDFAFANPSLLIKMAVSLIFSVFALFRRQT